MPATIPCPFPENEGHGRHTSECPLCKGKGHVTAYVGNERYGGSLSRSKYGNVYIEVDGHTFDSLAEARRYGELVWRREAGEIRNLRVHPTFPLYAPVMLASAEQQGKLRKVATYEADFAYIELGSGQTVVEDVKGKRTDVDILKRKWMAVQGIEVVEVKA